MTLPIAALVNIIVAPISQSLHRRHHTVVRYQRTCHITRTLVVDIRDRDISPRAFNDEESSNSDRSSDQTWRHRLAPRRVMAFESPRRFRFRVDPHSRTRSNPNLAADDLVIVKRRDATSHHDPPRGTQFERGCHP